MFDLTSYFITSFTIAAIIVVLLYWIRIYNSFQAMTQTIFERLSNIEVLVRQRLDMIQTIVTIAKKYNLHENQTFRDVIEARAHWDTKAPLSERIRALAGLEDNMFKINAVVEQYPDLKAELIQSEVLKNDVQIENQIASSRLLYNNSVRSYNSQVVSFPTNIVARLHHFNTADYLSFNTSEFVPKQLYE